MKTLPAFVDETHTAPRPISPALLIFATAFLWWLAGAFQIFPLGWVALVPLWILVHDRPAKTRFKLGYLTGFASFALINWWLIPTITRGAQVIDAPAIAGFGLSLVAVTFIAAVHGAQVALVSLLAQGNSPWRPLVLALAWTFVDATRTFGPIAHSWGALGFSQAGDWLLLNGTLGLGQHALTFLCAFVAAYVAFWFRTRRMWPIGMCAGLLVLWHIVGFFYNPRASSTKPLRVLLVQTGVSSLRKTGRAAGETPFNQAMRLTQEATRKEKFDLIVWPETTMTASKFGANYNGLDFQQWRLNGPKTLLLAGSNSVDERGRRFNEAILIAPDGSAQSYGKRRLVPFGERAPFVEYLPFLAAFAQNPMVESGQSESLLTHTGKPAFGVDVAICFETCFPLNLPRAGDLARFTAITTNDEWFGSTEAARQHRAMAQIRAVETGRPLVQSCNERYSFLIDPRGRIVVTTPNDLPQTLAVTVELPDVAPTIR